MALTGLAEGDDDESDEREEGEDGRERFQSAERLLQRLRQQRAELAQIILSPDLPLVRNLNLLAALLGLSEAELAVLCFAVFLWGIAPSSPPKLAEHEYAVSPQAVGAIDRPPPGRHLRGPEFHQHPDRHGAGRNRRAERRSGRQARCMEEFAEHPVARVRWWRAVILWPLSWRNPLMTTEHPPSRDILGEEIANCFIWVGLWISDSTTKCQRRTTP